MSLRTMRKVHVGNRAGVGSLCDVTDPTALALGMTNIGEANKQEFQHKAFMRPSALAGSCVRYLVLGHRQGLTETNRVAASFQMLGDIGKAVHSMLQNDPKYFGKSIVGWWRCGNCGYKYFGRYPRANCFECKANSQVIRYYEHRREMTSPYRLRYRLDLLLHFGSIRIGEIKTISAKKFNALTAPLQEHREQWCSYLLATDNDDTIPVPVDTSSGFMIYVSREFTNILPMKIFVVRRNQVEADAVAHKLLLFKDGVEGKRLPPIEEQCSASDWSLPKALRCPVAGACREAG